MNVSNLACSSLDSKPLILVSHGKPIVPRLTSISGSWASNGGNGFLIECGSIFCKDCPQDLLLVVPSLFP